MKRFYIVICIVLTFAIGACELTQPDSDDMKELIAGIDMLPPDQQSILYRERDRMRADEWLERNKSRRVAVAKCADRDEELDAGDLLAHLLDPAHSGQTFVDLLDSFRQRVEKTYPGCEFEWDVPAQRELFTELEKEDDDAGTARWIVSLTSAELRERPALMAAIGLVLVGGVIVASPMFIGPTLCGLSAAVVCPDDPRAPGVPQPVPGGGGDQ